MNDKQPITITKVKIAKGKIKINYDKSKDGFSESFQMVSEEKAAPEFYDAFNILRGHVAAIMNLDGSIMENRISPNEVTFSYDELGLMTEIGFNFYIPLASEYVPVITPARKEPEHPTGNDTDHPELLTSGTLNALHNVINNAVLYLKGERAQENLFKEMK